MNNLILLMICLVGLGVFCSCLLVMMFIWSYWIYKYPIVEEVDDVDWENEDYEFD